MTLEIQVLALTQVQQCSRVKPVNLLKVMLMFCCTMYHLFILIENGIFHTRGTHFPWVLSATCVIEHPPPTHTHTLHPSTVAMDWLRPQPRYNVIFLVPWDLADDSQFEF